MFHKLLLLGTLALSAQPQHEERRDTEPRNGTPPTNEVTIVVPRESDLTFDEVQGLAVAVARFTRSDQSEEAAPAREDEVYITGHEYLWLDPRDAWIADEIESTAREVALGLIELDSAEGDLEISDRGDTVVFKIDQGDSVRLLILERTADDLTTVMAGRLWLPTGNADARLEMQIVDGEVNVAALKREVNPLADAEEGGATATDCAASGNGVCCSFQDGRSVRIVCMCYGHDGQHGPRFVKCGDTGWSG